MPLVARVIDPLDDTQSIFQCRINDTGTKYCNQCQFITAKGTRCRKNTCMDLTYCWIHLRIKHRVRIAPSLIKVNGKSIGLGLYAQDPNTHEDKRAIVFRKGDIIGRYVGEEIKTQEQLAHRYDKFVDKQRILEQTAPYAVVQHNGKIYDALCHRNFIAYANDARGTNMTNNATLNPRSVYLHATKNIRNGDEILWNYTKGYWEAPIAQVKYSRENKNSKSSKSSRSGRSSRSKKSSRSRKSNKNIKNNKNSNNSDIRKTSRKNNRNNRINRTRTVSKKSRKNY
jgi:hypothetical protein